MSNNDTITAEQAAAVEAGVEQEWQRYNDLRTKASELKLRAVRRWTFGDDHDRAQAVRLLREAAQIELDALALLADPGPEEQAGVRAEACGLLALAQKIEQHLCARVRPFIQRRWRRAMGEWRALASRCARLLNRAGWLHVRPVDVLHGWESAGYLPSKGFTHRPARVGPRAELAEGLAGAAARLRFPGEWSDLDFTVTWPRAYVKAPRESRMLLRRMAKMSKHYPPLPPVPEDRPGMFFAMVSPPYTQCDRHDLTRWEGHLVCTACWVILSPSEETTAAAKVYRVGFGAPQHCPACNRAKSLAPCCARCASERRVMTPMADLLADLKKNTYCLFCGKAVWGEPRCTCPNTTTYVEGSGSWEGA